MTPSAEALRNAAAAERKVLYRYTNRVICGQPEIMCTTTTTTTHMHDSDADPDYILAPYISTHSTVE